MNTKIKEMRETLLDLIDALNPWYFLYLAIIFAIIAISGNFVLISSFLCILSTGLLIKNWKAWNKW